MKRIRRLPILLVALAVCACSPARRIDLVAVEDQIRNVLQLRTYEHVYRDVVYFGEERSFLFVTTVDRALLFSIDIRVAAGIDLEDGIELTRDRNDPARVYVRLPDATVVSVDADESTIREYFIRERGGRIGLLEIGDQIDAVKEATVQDAIERGILEKATRNAERLVRSFLTLAGFEEVVFATPTPERDPEMRG